MNADELLSWYNQNKRDLPWRENKQPYYVWLSEIMLQQTRVAQALPYFLKFVEAFPTVTDLANADEQEVLKLWQGLGYYSRARNLHACAKKVSTDFGGVFPNTFKDLVKLPGVGNYTASAIASFCFNEDVVVVDGNVYRVISRLFGEQTPINDSAAYKLFYQLTYQFKGNTPAQLFNQAIMEFGALQCTPKSPNCQDCPFSLGCYALNHNMVDKLPFKKPKKQRKKQTLHYKVIRNEEGIFLRKRIENRIWKNLYDFPEEINISAEPQEVYGPVKHQLTHIEIEAFFELYPSTLKVEPIDENSSFVPFEELKSYPTSRLVENFLKDELGLID
jgi:A/G-specific adenine glycosylase